MRAQQFNFIIDPEYFAFCYHLKSKTIYQNKEVQNSHNLGDPQGEIEKPDQL